jgi:hypothetical protein
MLYFHLMDEGEEKEGKKGEGEITIGEEGFPLV